MFIEDFLYIFTYSLNSTSVRHNLHISNTVNYIQYIAYPVVHCFEKFTILESAWAHLLE